MKRPLIAFAALSAVLATTPALAGEHTKVAYRDLNLATVEGQQALDKRIDRAARKVCGMDDFTLGTRIRDNASRNCYYKAKKQARQQMATLVDDQRLGG